MSNIRRALFFDDNSRLVFELTLLHILAENSPTAGASFSSFLSVSQQVNDSLSLTLRQLLGSFCLIPNHRTHIFFCLIFDNLNFSHSSHFEDEHHFCLIDRNRSRFLCLYRPFNIIYSTVFKLTNLSHFYQACFDPLYKIDVELGSLWIPNYGYTRIGDKYFYPSLLLSERSR